MILVVSGPSGSGKTALLEVLYERGFGRVVPYTTRLPRAGEAGGVDYHFVPRPRFREMIVEGDLVDWDFVFGNYYGYGRDLEERALAGEDVAIPVVARMALRLRTRLPGTYLAFVDAEDAGMDRRLAERGTLSEEERQRRDAREEEREHASMFDSSIMLDRPLRKESFDRLLSELGRSGKPAGSED